MLGVEVAVAHGLAEVEPVNVGFSVGATGLGADEQRQLCAGMSVVGVVGEPTLKASLDEAALAVRLYNDPAEKHAFEGFIVHMHLAWLYIPLPSKSPHPEGTDEKYCMHVSVSESYAYTDAWVKKLAKARATEKFQEGDRV